MTDAVNSPPHYQHLPGIEVIDITEHLNFCIGNVVKYVLRADHKGRPLEDLRKAAWYLDREIARREAEKPTEWTASPGSIFEMVADTARGCDITEAEAARRLAKALNDPVVEPLAKTGPRDDAIAPFYTPDHARYDDQHVRGEE